MEQIKKSVDIVVPIYNAYEELLLCIASIKRNTDLEYHRLILINDASSDKRIASYLDSLKAEHIIVVHNDVNRGFPTNINIGLAQSAEHDVILLNSDTIVTKNWVEKIAKCAYSDEMIATVTPLSNNATIYSVPEYFQENRLPVGFTLDGYAELVERCSLKKYPTTPMAHGFCMFVKRAIINKIGGFDAETFGKGYGEENDFCYRAEQLGYHHVMCDDTYIYHSGTSSFLSDEKKRNIKAHEQIIKHRYPDQHQNTVIYCSSCPNEDIRMNIKIQTILNNGKKNILYLLHSDFRLDAEDNIGGTQLHVKDLCEGIRDEMNVFVVARNYNFLNLTAYIGEEELLFQYYIGGVTTFPIYRDKNFACHYEKILDSFQIDIVHIHHTANLSLELYYQAAKKNIPIFTTLHDYYTICPTIKLLNQEGLFCKDISTPSMCQHCLKKRCGIEPTIDFISEWRIQQGRVLQLSSKIFVPSESTKELILEFYPEKRDKICVVQHGLQPLGNVKNASKQTMRVSKMRDFHVAFIGGISEEKGGYYALQMIKHADTDIRWHLFGILGMSELETLSKKNFIRTGKYQREDLPALFQKYQIDLVCILSICPETYCYTLSESLLCGVPVIVTDIGALGERVRELQCGWIFPTCATYEDVLNLINTIKDKGVDYQEKKNFTMHAHIKNTIEMCNEYSAIYNQEIRHSTKRIQRNINYFWILQGRGKALGDLRLQGAEGEVYAQLALVEQRFRDITGSMTYKIVKTLISMRIPFRSQLRKMLLWGNSFVKDLKHKR